MKKSQKITALFLAICSALIFALPITAFAQGDSTTLSLTSATCKAGETVKISLNIDEPSNVCAMRVYVLYDVKYLTLESAKWGDAMVIGKQSITPQDGSINFMAATFDGSKTLNQTGALANMEFTVKDGTPDGDYPVTLYIKSDGDFIDKGAKAVACSLKNGKVTVSQNSTTAASEDKDAETTKKTEDPRKNDFDVDGEVDKTIEDFIDNKINSSDSSNSQTSESTKNENVKVFHITKAVGADKNSNTVVMDVPEGFKGTGEIKVYKYDTDSDTLIEIKGSKVADGVIEFEALDDGYYVFAKTSSGKVKAVVMVCADAVVAVGIVVSVVVTVKKKKAENGASVEPTQGGKTE